MARPQPRISVTRRTAIRKIQRKISELRPIPSTRRRIIAARRKKIPIGKQFRIENEEFILDGYGRAYPLANPETPLSTIIVPTPHLSAKFRTFIESPKGKFIEIANGKLKMVYDENTLDTLHFFKGQRYKEHSD
ncbi:MAG: hypothetical protein HY544_03870 [Candidatus Diapherotrites archaeon]|uniref:Uncharacterized protein n=1 Tax=Candidatus Iainarchaeum sp. TaxID=3101447 RepID=A0A8T3YKP3_9ARCH|nr:hypothetical protein [Candidatus Diapherotrites archaeon]